MNSDKSTLKRILAREILFFFAGLLLIGLAWSFLLLRNSYYENKVNSCSEKINSLQVQLDTFPKDYIKEFYDLTSRYFVVNYKLDNAIYAIPKEQEKDFLTDEFGIQKKVTPVSIYTKGYSYFKINSITIKPDVTIYFSNKEDLGKQIKKQYVAYTDISEIELGNRVLKKFTQNTDSTIVFDFVPIEKFRKFVSSVDYQDKLYKVFANNSRKNDWIPPLDAVRADFDPMKPYNGIFPLGTLSDFKSRMDNGLKFNSTVVERKSKVVEEITGLRNTITASQNDKLTSIEIQKFVIYSAAGVGILLYVLRLSIALIVWAVRTMKQNSSQ